MRRDCNGIAFVKALQFFRFAQAGVLSKRKCVDLLFFEVAGAFACKAK